MLFILAWVLVGYAVAKHKLLNRKIFISRKIVYSAIAPIIFTAYLLGIGIVSLLMHSFNLPLPFVLRWFFIIAGLVMLIVFVMSNSIRQSIKFFISSHFYVNKYQYRDEWLAFSKNLQGALS